MNRVAFYLPDPLQDVGGEGGHPRRTARELHQHGEQLEEGIGRLAEGEHRVSVRVCFSAAPSGRREDGRSYLRSQLGDGREEHRHDLWGGQGETDKLGRV